MCLKWFMFQILLRHIAPCSNETRIRNNQVQLQRDRLFSKVITNRPYLVFLCMPYHVIPLYSGVLWDFFYWHGLTLIPTCVSNYINHKVWNEITYLYANFNGCPDEVLDMWLLIHAGIKVNPWQWKGSLLSFMRCLRVFHVWILLSRVLGYIL